MPSKTDIAALIREGTLRRQEEQRRRQQLQQELREVKRAEKEEHERSGATKYLTNILIFLVFVSFPLSERVVDWGLVGLFCALNVVWCVVSSFLAASWMSVTFIVLSNFLLVRWSHTLYDLPVTLAAVPPVIIAAYLGCNAFGMALLYAFYVDPELEMLRGRAPLTKKARRSAGAHNKPSSMDDSALDEFARQQARLERMDIALSVVLVANMVAAVCLGWVPLEGLLQGASALLRLLK